MFTRADYMAQRCSHEEYYGQLVTPSVLAAVRAGIGEDAIRASTDPHFNDIHLARWDQLSFWPAYPEGIGDFPTLSGKVCVAKTAAKMIKDGKA